MKILLAAFSLLILLTGGASAETKYISDTLVVTVRAQPIKGAEVLATVVTGAPLEILETLKGFVRVRTEKGIEGYVQSQYVNKEMPKAVKIAQLKAENSQLKQELVKLTKNLSTSKNQTLSLSTTEEELARLKKDFQSLQKTSAAAIQISQERDQLQQENNDLAGRMQQLNEEKNLYLRTAVIKWFLAGAGVLFLGWILGKLSRKNKRNRLYL